MSVEDVSKGMTLESLIKMLKKVMRFWPWVLVAAIVFAPLGAYYGWATFSQEYYLSIIMAVGGQNLEPGEERTYISTSELDNLAQTYSAIIHTDQFYSAVAHSLSFDISEKQISSAISVDVPKGTSLVKIGVTLDNPDKTSEIMDAIRKNLTFLIIKTYGDMRIGWIEGYAKPILLQSMSIMKRTALYGCIAAAVGMFIGAMFALIVSIFDKRVWDFDECTQITGLRIMGVLLKSKIKREKQEENIYKLLHSDPKSKHSMRILAAALKVRFSQMGNCFVLLGTSGDCSVHAVCAHLCEAFARQGKSAILIDIEGHLKQYRRSRKKSAESRIFDDRVIAASREESELEDDSKPPQSSAQAWSISKIKCEDGGNFEYLAFDKGLNSSGVQARIDTINCAVSEMRLKYNVIVIAAPPLIINDEFLMIASDAQEVLPVFEYKKTKMQEIEQTLHYLNSIGIKAMGCVWTGLDKRIMKQLY